MESEHTIELFALTLPYAPNMVDVVPADSVAHGGVSIGDATAVDGFSVILFAYVGQAENDLITLYLNDEFASKVTIAKGKEAENTTLTIPSRRFQRGQNQIKFGVKRPSQNEEFTKDLILLYRSSPPGDVPPVLAINVSHESIGADEADDVSVTVTYKNAQWYDRIFVDCNGVVVRHQLVPDVEPPVSAAPQTVIIPIAREVLKQGGDDSDFTFKFRVVDNLTNPSGPPTWSDIVNADVHLNRLTLAMPILREILTENNDDPATVDLAKLNGNPLSALIHLVETIWKVGDSIKLVFTAELNGSVVATHEETSPITQVPGQFVWSIPNSKIIANSTVTVVHQLVRGGTVIATSLPAKAQVIGQSVPDVEVTFSNAPYRVAPRGRVKDIKLILMQAGLPISGTIKVALPEGTVFPDGAGGTRDFKTQSDGTLTISGVTGAATSGTFSLTASSGRDTETATLIVMGAGPLGPITVGGDPTGITISPDGTLAYVTGYRLVQVIDTGSSALIQQISVPTQDVSWDIAPSRNGILAFACDGSNAVSVIDTDRSMLIASIPASGHPIGIVLSQDGSLAFVSTWNGNSVVVIDTVNLKAVKTIPVGSYPRGIDINPQGSEVYVGNAENIGQSISVIDTRTLTVSRTLPMRISPYGVAVSPDGNHLYICGAYESGQGVVKQINAQTGAEVREILVIGYPRGIVVNRAGTQAYCCEKDINKVSVIDLVSGAVIRTIPVGQGPLMIAISHDDTRGFVTCIYDKTVWVISLLPGSGGMETESSEGLGVTNVASVPRNPIAGDMLGR